MKDCGYVGRDDLVSLGCLTSGRSNVRREINSGNHEGVKMIGYVVVGYAAVVGVAVAASGLSLSELANCF